MMIWAIYMYFDRLKAQLRHLEDIEHQKAWQRRLKDLFGLFGIKRLREDNGRLKARQRRFEAQSQENIIRELNNIDQRLKRQHRQGQEHIQQLPSAQSPNQTRTWCVMTQSALPHHPTVPPESDHKYGFLIWLLLLLPVASSQCSTCLGGKCYDTGQCILGCVRGYMNQYCDKACPSNCLNNACELNTTSATITCTDGCRPGYCGTKCTRPCPEGCVTCDRQCGSCNKTICPERHYGEGCRSVCSLKYEKCDKETGQCIICRQGYYGDNCNRTCDTCCSRGQNLMYKCLSGCEICKEEDSCPEGLFGGNCELKCSEKCGKSQETARHPCNRATGECAAGCMSGYYGLTCNHACSEHCLSGRCNRATGECSDGCVSGYYGLTCTFTCDGFCKGELCNQHDGVCTYGCVSGYTQKSKACEKLHDTGVKDVTISFTVLTILISCIVVSVLFWVIVCIIITRRFITRIKLDRPEYADKKAMECLREEKSLL